MTKYFLYCFEMNIPRSTRLNYKKCYQNLHDVCTNLYLSEQNEKGIMYDWLWVMQALCEAIAKTKIMSAEQVVKDEQGEEVRVVYYKATQL